VLFEIDATNEGKIAVKELGKCELNAPIGGVHVCFIDEDDKLVRIGLEPSKIPPAVDPYARLRETKWEPAFSVSKLLSQWDIPASQLETPLMR